MQKYQPGARQQDIAFKCELESESTWITADIALMERVFDNLIENALQHTPRGGEVAVTLHGTGQGLNAEVRDTGQGIAAEDLPRVFDRFYRGKSAGGDRGHVGLGLAIVKRILDLHAAKVAVDSAPGRGTRIRFLLPASS